MIGMFQMKSPQQKFLKENVFDQKSHERIQVPPQEGLLLWGLPPRHHVLNIELQILFKPDCLAIPVK